MTKDWHFRDHQVSVDFHRHHGDHDASGWLAGIQGGCDYQFGGPGGGFVIGIAADWAWANAEGDHVRFFDLWGDAVKGGINFRFGGLLGGPPIAARY